MLVPGNSPEITKPRFLGIVDRAWDCPQYLRKKRTDSLEASCSPGKDSHMIFSLPQNREYPHRTNQDGTIASICPHCYRTIGNSTWEAELEQIERAHLCEGAR